MFASFVGFDVSALRVTATNVTLHWKSAAFSLRHDFFPSGSVSTRDAVARTAAGMVCPPNSHRVVKFKAIFAWKQLQDNAFGPVG